MGEPMRFVIANSFEDNLALFKAEAEQMDPDCAKILFDNLATVCREGDAAHERASISDFHRAVLAALDQLPDPQEFVAP